MSHTAAAFSFLLASMWTSTSTWAEIAPETVVGSVLGVPITAAQVKLTELPEIENPFDARDKEQWDIMGRINGAFATPLIERFVEEHKLDATSNEIREFHDSSRRRKESYVAAGNAEIKILEVQLTSPDLSDTERAKLTKTLAQRQRLQQHFEEQLTMQPNDAIAKEFITRWKTERELQRTYGGRILFQQFGLEAFDARHKLYQEAEEQGDLTFAEPTVRRMFYYYFAEFKHGAFLSDKQAEMLEQPPWSLAERQE